MEVDDVACIVDLSQWIRLGGQEDVMSVAPTAAPAGSHHRAPASTAAAATTRTTTTTARTKRDRYDAPTTTAATTAATAAATATAVDLDMQDGVQQHAARKRQRVKSKLK